VEFAAEESEKESAEETIESLQHKLEQINKASAPGQGAWSTRSKLSADNGKSRAALKATKWLEEIKKQKSEKENNRKKNRKKLKQQKLRQLKLSKNQKQSKAKTNKCNGKAKSRACQPCRVSPANCDHPADVN